VKKLSIADFRLSIANLLPTGKVGACGGYRTLENNDFQSKIDNRTSSIW